MSRKHPLNSFGRGVLLIVVLFAGSLNNLAQNDSTSVEKQKVNIKQSVSKTYVDFTPEDVQLQKRYRPIENDILFPSLWYRRLYAGGGAGVSVVSDNFSSALQPQFFGYLGYKISPVHNLRARFTMSEYTLGLNAQKSKLYGFGVDYLSNLTNFALGYNPYRTFEISTVLGAGMMYSTKAIPNKVLPYAQLGLRLDAHLSSNVDVFLEPYVGLVGAADQVFGTYENPESWNLQYGINGGMQINFNERFNRFVKSDSVYRQPFIDASIGGVVSGRSGGIMHRSGVGYQAAVGMWLNPVLGLRIGLQGQSHHWASINTKLQNVDVIKNRDQVLFGARGEVMFNPLNIIKSWRDQPCGHDFDVNVLGGFDFGATRKAQVPGSATSGYSSYYYGLTGALQLLYRINNPGTYIYVEPRFSSAIYNNPNASGVGYSSTFSPYLSMNVGTRVYMNQNAFTKSGDDDFTPHWWMGAEFGGVKWQRSISYSSVGLGFNPTFGMSIGYDWKRLASFRAQLMYQRMYHTHEAGYRGLTSDNRFQYGKGLWYSAYNQMDLRLSYMMNISTLLQGYQADRCLNLWFTAGPSFSYTFSQDDNYIDGQTNPIPELEAITLDNKKSGKVSPGLYTSLLATMRVTPRMDVTAEAYGQYNILPGVNPGDRGRLNSAKYGVSVGSRYHFEPGQLLDFDNEDYKDFFFDGSLGWASNSASLHNAGTQYSIAMGKWINPLWGIRLGLNGSSSKYKSEVADVEGIELRNGKTMAMASARAELMVNPLNFFNQWRAKEGGHDFDMNLLVGGDLGLIAKNGFGNGRFYSKYLGFTSALQFLYRVNNPGTYIYLEPRYLSANYKAPYTGTNVSRGTSDNLFSMSMGVRTYLTNPSFRPANASDMTPSWWMGVDFGGMKVQRSSVLQSPNALGFNPSLGLSVGYDYKPLASFRGQLLYQHYSDYAKATYSALAQGNKYVSGSGVFKRNYNLVDLRLAYMLNLNNLFQGYDAARKLNFWFTAGPGLTFMLAQNNSWVDGQTMDMQDASQVSLANSRAGKVSPTVHGSFMTTYKLTDKVDLTAEASGQVNLLPNVNPGNKGLLNSIKYGFSVGTRYHLTPGQLSTYGNSDYKKFFVDANVGWAANKISLHNAGTQYSLALGKWVNSVWGVRLGLNASNTKHEANLMQVDGVELRLGKTMAMGAARAELMLNPLNFFNQWREKDGGRDFDLNLLLGADLGGIAKNDFGNGRFFSAYYGFTSAMQLLYRVTNPGTYIYLEPRYLSANYKAPYRGTTIERNVTDNLFSMSMGVRTYLTNPSFRPTNASEMSPSWWMGLDFGSMKVQRSSMLQSPNALGFNPSLSISVGYDYKPLASFRAQFAYQHYSDYAKTNYSGLSYNNKYVSGAGVFNRNYNIVDLRLAYMLNLGNLFQGYNANRKLNLWFTAGPGATIILSQNNNWNDNQTNDLKDTQELTLANSRTGKFAPTVHGSFMTTYKLSDKLDLTAEASGQVNLLPNVNPGNKGLLNSIKYGFSVGTRYHFVPGQFGNYANNDYKDFFVDANVGWATNKISLHNAGTQYSLAFGKWMNSVWGIRLGLNASSSKHEAELSDVAGVQLRNGKILAMAGARTELMINPLNFINSWRTKNGGHEFDMNVLLGADLGGIVKNGFANGRFHATYYGFTTAMQLLYRINNPGTYLYLEPRYLTASYNAPYTGTNIKRNVTDNLFSLSMGVRTYLTNPSLAPANSAEMISGWWVGADFGSMKVLRSSKLSSAGALGMNPSLTLSAGYDYKPLASFRAQIAYQYYSDYANTSYRGLTTDNKLVSGTGLWNRNYNIMDLRLAYMLNLNNLFQGYDAKRKFNLWMTSGPGLSFMLSQNNNWVEEQTNQLVEAEQYKLQNDRDGKVSPTLHASFMTAYKVSNKVDLTAEALGQLNVIPGTNPGNKGLLNSLKYNFSLGARYHFDYGDVEDMFSGSELKPWNRGWMLEATYGWALPSSLGASGSGSSMHISTGRWITNVFGFRIGLGGSQSYWDKSEHASYSRYSEQMKIGGRLELMINPLNVLASRKRAELAPKFDLNMSLGFAFGGFAKVHGAQRGGYTGFTAAIDALYRVSSNTQLFVEPRIETQGHKSIIEVMGFRKKYTDKLFTLNIGARVSRPVGESKESKRPIETAKMAHRGWWVAGSFGGSKMNQTVKISSTGLGLNPSFTFGIGNDMSRLSSFRAQVAYDIHSRLRPNQRYSMLVNDRNVNYTGLIKSMYHQLDIRLQYMLNMSNLWTGYDKRTKFNAYWAFGPSFSTLIDESHSLVGDYPQNGTDFKYVGTKHAGQFSVGLSTSALMTLAITERLDATAEVAGQYHLNRRYMPENHHQFLNGVKINFSIGARYNF